MIPYHKTSCKNIVVDWKRSTYDLVLKQLGKNCPFCKNGSLHSKQETYIASIMCFWCQYSITFYNNRYMMANGYYKLIALKYRDIEVSPGDNDTLIFRGSKILVAGSKSDSLNLKVVFNLINNLILLKRI